MKIYNFYNFAPNQMEIKLIPWANKKKKKEFINDFVVKLDSVVAKILQRKRTL